MSGKAAKILLTETQQDILQKITRSTTSAQRLMQRARVILLAFEGRRNDDIATLVKLNRKQVGLWRRRWKESFDALVSIECRETGAALRRAVEDVLNDAQRSGTHGIFSAEQITQIMAIACEPPEHSARPVDHWTHSELADQAAKRKIVSSISPRQVGRYLAAAELQPHRSKYWLNTTEKDEHVFQTQVEVVCQTWREAPNLYFQANTHTVSVDEMPGLQALERIAETIPMKPNQPKRIEYEYRRHGTLCLIGNWHVVEGQMISSTIKATRTESDFAWHIHNTVRTDAGWVFVLDNLNVHCSATLVGYVADLEGIDKRTLGKKGRSGVLKSVESRQKFLSDRSHRIRFVYLPKHTSWLNQIEIVFGIVSRRVMRRGNFKSLENLKERLIDFINYFNRTFAKPFQWNYTGRPVRSDTIRRPSTWKENWRTSRQCRRTSALVT
ncbi:MAG: transposase [Planctomycetaceae bacterium]